MSESNDTRTDNDAEVTDETRPDAETHDANADTSDANADTRDADAETRAAEDLLEAVKLEIEALWAMLGLSEGIRRQSAQPDNDPVNGEAGPASGSGS